MTNTVHEDTVLSLIPQFREQNRTHLEQLIEDGATDTINELILTANDIIFDYSTTIQEQAKTIKALTQVERRFQLLFLCLPDILKGAAVDATREGLSEYLTHVDELDPDVVLASLDRDLERGMLEKMIAEAAEDEDSEEDEQVDSRAGLPVHPDFDSPEYQRVLESL